MTAASGPCSPRSASAAPGLIGGRPVLAELVLGLHRGDGQLHPHDRLELPRDELGRGILHPPRMQPCLLVPAGQPGHHLAQPVRVLVEGDGAGQVHLLVVPGRHHPAVLGRARVPGRGDVGLRPVHDGQGLGAGLGGAPLRVGPGQVAEQAAVTAGRIRVIRGGRAGAGRIRPGLRVRPGGEAVRVVPDHRQQGGDGLAAVEGDQVRGLGRVHERGDLGQVGDGELARDIHRARLCAAAGRTPTRRMVTVR